MAQYVAAVHQGTTDTHFMVFDRGGRVVASMHKEHAQIRPQSGWLEHDPMEIWKCTQDVIKGALQKSGVKAEEIAAIGVTNQRETTVVWNKNSGKPYHKAIVWQDARTKDICDKLAKDGGQDRFRPKVGLPLAIYFSGPKIRWILDKEGVRAAARRGDALFGNMDTWEIWWLTGGPNGGAHVTDVTNASRTMLMDLETRDWDQGILDIMDIPRQMLPEIRPSSDPRVYGYTSKNGPLGTRIPVCGDLGDQQAHLFGQTCYCEGEAKSTYYSMGDCLMLFNTGSEPFPSKYGRLLTTVAYGLPEGTTYALEGSFTFGAAVQWLRDDLRLVQSDAKAEEIARSVDDAGGIYFVPAFSGLSAPHWDKDARGLISGLTRDVTRAHIVRAALESICYQTRDMLEVMQADSGIARTVLLKVNGDATANDLLMQLQADVLGVRVVRPKVQETAALGAAYAAGLATGLWSGLKELRTSRTEDRVFCPQGDRRRHEFAYAGWSEAVERSKSAAMTRKPPEREFEDRVIVPLLRAWGFQYEREYPVQVGNKNFFADFRVSDEQEPLTVFEDKSQITGDKDLQSAVEQAKWYAIRLRLPSFVVASPEGMWLYSLDRNEEKLEKKFSTAAMKDLNQEDEFNEFKRLLLLSSLRK